MFIHDSEVLISAYLVAGVENLRKQMEISMSSPSFQSSEGDILNIKLARNQTCVKKEKKKGKEKGNQ